MFWDHDAKWCIHILGGAEIDSRFSIPHPHTGFRQFHEGIKTEASHWTRTPRHQALHLTGNRRCRISICSLMDFRYLAQAPQISDQTCAEINLALKEFHDHKDTIISSCARTGKRGKVIDNWYIPKLELLQSVTSSIRESGAAIQWTAYTTERYHITEIKEPLREAKESASERPPSRAFVSPFFVLLSPRARHNTTFKPRHKTSTTYTF